MCTLMLLADRLCHAAACQSFLKRKQREFGWKNHREKKKLAFEQKVKYNITKGQMVRKGI